MKLRPGSSKFISLSAYTCNMYTSSVLVRCSLQEMLKIKNLFDGGGGGGGGTEERKRKIKKKLCKKRKKEDHERVINKKGVGKVRQKNGIPASGTHLAWKGNM
jgi:hypothetical protein